MFIYIYFYVYLYIYIYVYLFIYTYSGTILSIPEYSRRSIPFTHTYYKGSSTCTCKLKLLYSHQLDIAPRLYNKFCALLYCGAHKVDAFVN